MPPQILRSAREAAESHLSSTQVKLNVETAHRQRLEDNLKTFEGQLRDVTADRDRLAEELAALQEEHRVTQESYDRATRERVLRFADAQRRSECLGRVALWRAQDLERRLAETEAQLKEDREVRGLGRLGMGRGWGPCRGRAVTRRILSHPASTDPQYMSAIAGDSMTEAALSGLELDMATEEVAELQSTYRKQAAEIATLQAQLAEIKDTAQNLGAILAREREEQGAEERRITPHLVCCVIAARATA